jgi:pyruvate-ferredoxin/flavodoxin oxidoreductase
MGHPALVVIERARHPPGIVNREYLAQRAILADVDAGKLSIEELFTRGHELAKERIGAAAPAKA